MNAIDLQERLQELLDAVIEARDDDDHDLADLAAEAADLSSVTTYCEAEILTHDPGLVVECEDGRAFQVTIVRSR